MKKQPRFSDLLVSPSGKQFLKGTGQGFELVDCPDGPEATRLLDSARTAWETSGQDSFRLEHDGTVFRAAVLQDLHGPAFFLRRMPARVPSFERLGFPSAVAQWLTQHARKGLVLFAGSQCSGKTTSASSLVCTRLANDGGHAVTFENPVEMPLYGQHGKGFCFQSEVSDEAALAQAVERSHRYCSPEIIFIGEIRTKYAAAQVLRAALGSDRQLVVATIHGLDLATALDRLLTFARELDGEIAAHNLAQTLTAAVFQRLEDQDGKKVLRLPEYLLLPFDDRSRGIRAKLRSGDVLSLSNDIREIQNRLKYGMQP